MLHWSLLGEYYSLVILTILFIRYYIYERNAAKTSRRKQFVYCLTMSIALICLNILCVYTLAYPQVIPRWVNILLNTLYFQWAICVSSQFAYLLFDTMLEHVYDKHCLQRAAIMLGLVMVISVVMIVVNLFTGFVFYIDSDGLYHRGPLNRAYYGLLLVQLLFLGICYIRNRSTVCDRMLYVIRSVPPLILALCVLQFAYPDILLNGTICATVSLVIFIAFRSHTDAKDSLTSAGSRKALMDELALRSGSGQAVHIIQISVLNMAEINLRYSHDIGDALLYEVAHYLRHCMEDVQVFRSGGTTFSVMLPLESQQIAEQRLQAVIRRFQVGWVLGQIHCMPTYAVADYRSSGLTGTPSEIVEKLEYTMAQAKQEPPLARFEGELDQQLCRRLHLKDLIRRSIDRNRFRVVFQPMYCCRRDLFCSAEALLRLDDDDGTPVPPDVFIPVAEECGMSVELTLIVLDAACRLLATAPLPGLESVSVNLSTRQLMDRNLPAQIREYLDVYHLAPERLRVEITEQFILYDPRYAREQMSALEAMGIQIYMDDFGTGYSNLSSVLYYPFNFVKLDRSLIQPVIESRKAAIMVDSLLKLFRNLDKRVIMEGVETQEQVDFLRSIGIDMIQGFYYARPVPPEGLTEYFGKPNER